MTTRRHLLIGSIALWADIGRAQRTPVVVGLLLPGSEAFEREDYDGLVRELRALGYSKERLTIILRADGNESRLPALADELVRLKVDLIITGGTNASIAARGATPTIPILFYQVADPVASGLAGSLARPGANSTGLTNFSGRLLTEKRVALLKQLLPNLTRVAYLTNPVTGNTRIGPSIAALGETLGFATLVVRASSSQELGRAFQAIASFHAQAVIIQVDPFFGEVRDQIAELLVRNRLPSMFANKLFVEAGGLMSYGADEDSNLGQVAIYADKILRGERPADLPIQQPTNFELVVNRRTAEAIGLKVPPALLLQAARVIE